MEDDEIFRFFSPRFSRNSTNTSRSTGNNEEDEDGEEEGEDRGRSTNNNTGERMPPNPQFADLLQNLLSNFGGENLTTRGSAEQPFLYFSGDLDSNGGIRPRTSTRPQRTPASDARSTETNEDDDDDNTQNNDTNDNSNNEPGTMPEGGNRLNSLNR